MNHGRTGKSALITTSRRDAEDSLLVRFLHSAGVGIAVAQRDSPRGAPPSRPITSARPVCQMIEWCVSILFKASAIRRGHGVGHPLRKGNGRFPWRPVEKGSGRPPWRPRLAPFGDRLTFSSTVMREESATVCVAPAALGGLFSWRPVEERSLNHRARSRTRSEPRASARAELRMRVIGIAGWPTSFRGRGHDDPHGNARPCGIIQPPRSENVGHPAGSPAMCAERRMS